MRHRIHSVCSEYDLLLRRRDARADVRTDSMPCVGTDQRVPKRVRTIPRVERVLSAIVQDRLHNQRHGNVVHTRCTHGTDVRRKRVRCCCAVLRLDRFVRVEPGVRLVVSVELYCHRLFAAVDTERDELHWRCTRPATVWRVVVRRVGATQRNDRIVYGYNRIRRIVFVRVRHWVRTRTSESVEIVESVCLVDQDENVVRQGRTR